MSNIFANVKTAKGDKVEEDFLGGGGALDTDIYPVTFKTVYLTKAQSSQAQAVNFILDINGREVNQRIWVMNKAGGVTYKDKKSGEAKNLPGYSQVNAAAMLIVGKELGELDTEERTVKIYDHSAGKEIPQAVQCFVEFHGETGNVALQRQTVDKTKKNDATGDYEPTGETRDENEIIKFFPGDKLVTISEVEQFIKGLGESFDDTLSNGFLLKAISKMDDEAGNYADKWLAKNKGQTYDKSSGKKAEGKAFGGGSAKSGASEDKPTAKTNLFDD